jgi:hypothetical protein
MQNKKMTNPTDGINETNKKLRSIYEQICCISAILPPLPNYDILKLYSLGSGDAQTFIAGKIHSIAWELGSGASITIDNGSTAVTYTSSGSITFSTLNVNEITFDAVGGTVRLIVTTNDD